MGNYVVRFCSVRARVAMHGEMEGVMVMNMRRLQVLGSMCCIAGMLALTPAAQGAPEAVCVPWVSGNPSVAHYSYDGAEVRLKGIARGGATEFRWDYGDGGGTPWMGIGDPYT